MVKRDAVAFVVGLGLGALTCYLVLRAATQRYETRAVRAEAAATVLEGQADVALAEADSLRRLRPDTVRVPQVVTRTRIQTIIQMLPAPAAVDSLVAIVAERDSAIADRDRDLGLADREIGALRQAEALQRARGDTLAAALESRPSAVVTWDWRPKVNGQVFGDYRLSGDWCAGAGPTVRLWRAEAMTYGAACQPRGLPIEGQAGVRVTVRVF